MANNNCTSSVHELLKNVKGTPYGVEVRRSKKGKPQAISFNETVDSFKDVIEDDCSNADRHGRFADTPASEGGAVAACEQYAADKAPCFSVGGKIKSTTVLKSRLAKKYKEKDSYADYEDNKYEAMEKKKMEQKEIYYTETMPNFFVIKNLKKSNFNSLGLNTHEIEEFKKYFKWNRVENIFMSKSKNRNSEAILEKFGIIKKGGKPKSLSMKLKRVKAKKKPTPKKQNSIPSEICYEKGGNGKIILYLPKVWYNKMYPQYQKQIREYFKYTPNEKGSISKKKGAEIILKKMGIPEMTYEPIQRVTPEKVKPTKKKFTLATQTRSIGQGNQQQLGLSFISRLERLEKNDRSFANILLSMKPKVDKIEEDVEIIKQIVEVEHHNKGLQGDVF